MDLSLLQSSYDIAETPGLDTLDPRLAEITDLATQGQFTDASSAVAALLGEGICDIRLVGYLAYGPVSEQGPVCVHDAIVGFTTIFEETWDAYGPVKKKEKAAAAAVVWFVKQAMKRFQREEEGKGPVWKSWTTSMTPDEVDETTKVIRRFQGALDERLGAAAQEVLDTVSNLRTWLEGFRNSCEEPAAEPEGGDWSQNDGAAAEQGGGASSGGGGRSGGGLMASVGDSPFLYQLLAKMEAFGKLVERGEFKRALIAADDVNQALESFNPLLYFPSFFRAFAKFQAIHANELMEYAEYRETPEWVALRQLFLVDIDAFVDL
jgi:hypothetical protein